MPGNWQYSGRFILSTAIDFISMRLLFLAGLEARRCLGLKPAVRISRDYFITLPSRKRKKIGKLPASGLLLTHEKSPEKPLCLLDGANDMQYKLRKYLAFHQL